MLAVRKNITKQLHAIVKKEMNDNLDVVIYS